LQSIFSQDEIVLQKELEWYSGLISQHFEYFNELSDQHKQRFLLRVHSFRQKKEFHYIGLEASPQIPVLISAAAVQITFGLRKYRMSFFRRIYIMADQYTYGLGLEPWIGHVNRKGIYVSWKHFLHGYSVNSDRSNVGLHEMAHALVYANFLGGFNTEQHFVDHFETYQAKTSSLMREEKWKLCQLFSQQAINNYQECWAECAELFFENPLELNQEYPELYNTIKIILNQDPLNKIKILQPGVAA
jgi:Mlc titration factor MtfA (ptsG expression regulator)